MADVFLSYAREDLTFVRRLTAALRARNREVWVDLEDIIPSAHWLEEIRSGITEADAVVFVVTPDSVASKVCRIELDYATETSKRLVPILARETPTHTIPPALAEVNWLSFLDGADSETAIDQLIDVLDTDIVRVHLHTRLLTRAREWETHGRDRSLLLRGAELKQAESWLANQTGRKPAATSVQAQFILASRRAATRRQRGLVTIVTVVVVLSVALSLFSIVQSRRAGQQEQIAMSRRLAAEALTVADTQPDLALLLSLESLRTEATQDAWSSMQALLSRPAHPFRQLAGHTKRVAAVAFSPDGSLLATGDDSGMLRLWDTATNNLVAGPIHVSPGRLLWAGITDLAFSPDGKLLATATAGDIRLWDVASHQPIGDPFGISSGLLRALAFSSDGKRLVTTQNNGEISLWDVASRKPVGDIIDARAGLLSDVAFSPDGKLIAAGSEQGLVRTWDVATRQRIGNVKIPKGGAASVTFSHDGKRLAIGGYEGESYLLDVSTYKSVGKFLTQTEGVRDVAFSPDDKLLATAGATGAIRLWDLNIGQVVGNPLTGHVGQVKKVVFSPDGKRLATGGDDRTARLWNIATIHP